MIFPAENPIVTISDDHQYTNQSTGASYVPVSTFLDMFEPDVNWERIRYFMARKKLCYQIDSSWKKGDPEPTEEAIKQGAEYINNEWKEKARLSSEHGNFIHKATEIYNTTGFAATKNIESMCKMVNGFYNHRQHRHEFILHSNSDGLAGTPDRFSLRQDSDKSVVDFSDYKTNLYKGITFNSIREANGIRKHYNQFMKPPVTHLEACNYNRNALQISTYAYLFEQMYPGMPPGQLFILFIEAEISEGDITYAVVNCIPVPYLKSEVTAMIRYAKDRRALTDVQVQTQQTTGEEW